MYQPDYAAPVAESWGAQEPAAGQQNGEPVPEIFIGRVPQGIAKETLEAHFVPYGASNFRLLEGKGCAFCSFSSWASAEAAVQALNGLKLDGGFGEGINVKFADVKGNAKGKSQQHPKVFIGNIGQHATEEAMREVCQQFGFVTHTKIFARSAEAKPCAFVTFTSFSEAELCIGALNGAEHALALEGKVLNVRLADAIGRKTPPPGSIGKTPPSGITVPPSPAVALSMPTAQGLQMPLPFAPPPPAGQAGGQQGRPGTSGGTGPKIFIGGLPDAATEEFVWGMMAPYGDVTEAKIHRKPGAKPCGFARFATQGQADHAIAALAEGGRFAVRAADPVKPGGKRPMQQALPGLEAQDAWGNPVGMAGRGPARRLQ